MSSLGRFSPVDDPADCVGAPGIIVVNLDASEGCYYEADRRCTIDRGAMEDTSHRSPRRLSSYIKYTRGKSANYRYLLVGQGSDKDRGDGRKQKSSALGGCGRGLDEFGNPPVTAAIRSVSQMCPSLKEFSWR